ncbi:zinc finger protein MEP-1 isoform X2 [Arctopsyche grandis]|uniref:zinc finger protein MEP-1 isoform X2 n=1 Tax=Arctopsyche grandis TaxID=121162 RepID=UPI00406D906A
MNGTMDESMDTSSSEMPYSSMACKSPQSNSNVLNNHADSSNNTDSSVTENGHYQTENSQNNDKVSESNPQIDTQMEVDQNDDCPPTEQQADSGNKSVADPTNKRPNALDPLAESSSDSFQNTNINNVDKTNAVHSTTNLGETENSNDSHTSNSNMDQRTRNINNCANSNDSVVNSDSIDSSHIKNKTDSGSDDDSEEVQEIHSDSETDQVKTVTVNDEDSDEELDSEEDSSDDDMSDMSEGGVDVTSGLEEGPVSIHSDSEPEAVGDDSSKDSRNRINMGKSNEVLLVDDASNQGDDKTPQVKKPSSPVIHEITSDNDDCILTDEKMGDDDDDDDKKDLDNSSIRRSSRIMDKQTFKKYDYDNDDESDIEEVVSDPLNQNSKTKNAIVINNTKKLVDLAMKQNGKPGNNVAGQKKEPTVVIIDTNSILTTNKTQVPVPPKVPFSSLPPQALYESMAARGTTVTPLSAKPVTAPVAPPAPTPSPAVILPSLTDDMFVVEAPSFIVPYVYEKPSLKPFREFVDILGKELDEQIKKEEQERLEKEKEYREKMGLNKKEPEPTLDPSEAVVKNKDKDKPMEVDEEPSTAESKKGSNKKGRKKKKDDDDASWDGESTSDSDDEGLSDDERPKTIIIKEKDDDSLDAIKDPMITDLTSDKNAPKTNSYFDNSLGKFFINIGMNLVQEFVQSDLLKQQKRKLQRENRMGSGNVRATEAAISSLLKNLEFSKENNAPYKFQQKKCEFCSFKTESALSLAHHMETPHMKNGIYKCNFCPFEVRSPHDILFHMEAEHNTRGRLERAPSYHQCPNCPFEDNGKGKLGRHLISCAKKFKPEHNLIPPIEWEPPAKIPKATHARHSMMNSYQSVFAKMQANTQMTPGIMPQVVRGRGRPPLMPNLKPVQGAPMVRGGVMFKPSTPQQGAQQAASLQLPKVLQHQPSISITPLPRTTQTSVIPTPTPSSQSTAALSQGKSTFVICEICDGYIKDLEQLRNHMQWIHKVKIHPKMIYNRPPLNCQKCQFRFFTDQGLERHLLGSHGLVTSSMQEAANKGKDSGRCPICGRVYQWKLLNHVARDHNMTLKPAHLSYKCTVCTATFGMYRQFENHVYSAHSVVAKRAADKNKGPSAPAAGSSKVTVTPGGSLLKPVN